MIYILRSADGTIVGVGERDDWLPTGGQTVEVCEGTLAEYSERFALSADRTTICAGSGESAQVTVRAVASPPLESVEVRVNGQVQTVPLDGGVGMLTVQADAPGAVIVEPADPTRFCRAGRGTVVINVLEPLEEGGEASV